MTPRWQVLIPSGLATLFLIWAVWASIDHTILKIRAAMASEQTSIFAQMRADALAGDVARAVECLDYTVHYYPSGTKQIPGSSLDLMVERARSEAAAAIIDHLRRVTGLDLGDEPQPWIEQVEHLYRSARENRTEESPAAGP
jgi:hypothetical protein